MNKTFFFLYSFFFIKISCLFENAQYITESKDTEKLAESIEQKNKLALILLYSPYCPHCHKFAPQYEKLSIDYKDFADFYSINVVDNKNYRKKFSIYGVPTLFIYFKGEYKQHKGGNTYEIVSNVLEKNYIHKCEELDFKKYEKFKNSFINSKDMNSYIIGFFNSTELKDNYVNITKNFLDYIDKCYYSINNDQEENNLIISENKQRGKNIFNEYKSGIINETINDNYITFIINKVRNIYDEIIVQTNMYLLEYQDRDILIFSYKTESEREEFLKKILELDIFCNKNKTRLFNFILLKYDTVYSGKYKLNEYGIFLSNKNLDQIKKIENFTEIEIMIKGNNENGTEVHSNNTTLSQAIVDNYLQKYIEKNKARNIYKRNIILTFIFCFFGYCFIFYFIVRIYNKQKVENNIRNLRNVDKIETV